jgi:hypothetical protein
VANDLKIKQAHAQQRKTQKYNALHHHHAGLKFENFKFGVAQLA